MGYATNNSVKKRMKSDAPKGAFEKQENNHCDLDWTRVPENKSNSDNVSEPCLKDIKKALKYLKESIHGTVGINNAQQTGHDFEYLQALKHLFELYCDQSQNSKNLPICSDSCSEYRLTQKYNHLPFRKHINFCCHSTVVTHTNMEFAHNLYDCMKCQDQNDLNYYICPVHDHQQKATRLHQYRCIDQIYNECNCSHIAKCCSQNLKFPNNCEMNLSPSFLKHYIPYTFLSEISNGYDSFIDSSSLSVQKKAELKALNHFLSMKQQSKIFNSLDHPALSYWNSYGNMRQHFHPKVQCSTFKAPICQDEPVIHRNDTKSCIQPGINIVSPSPRLLPKLLKNNTNAKLDQLIKKTDATKSDQIRRHSITWSDKSDSKKDPQSALKIILRNNFLNSINGETTNTDTVILNEPHVQFTSPNNIEGNQCNKNLNFEPSRMNNVEKNRKEGDSEKIDSSNKRKSDYLFKELVSNTHKSTKPLESYSLDSYNPYVHHKNIPSETMFETFFMSETSSSVNNIKVHEIQKESYDVCATDAEGSYINREHSLAAFSDIRKHNRSLFLSPMSKLVIEMIREDLRSDKTCGINSVEDGNILLKQQCENNTEQSSSLNKTQIKEKTDSIDRKSLEKGRPQNTSSVMCDDSAIQRDSMHAHDVVTPQYFIREMKKFAQETGKEVNLLEYGIAPESSTVHAACSTRNNKLFGNKKKNQSKNPKYPKRKKDKERFLELRIVSNAEKEPHVDGNVLLFLNESSTEQPPVDKINKKVDYFNSEQTEKHRNELPSWVPKIPPMDQVKSDAFQNLRKKQSTDIWRKESLKIKGHPPQLKAELNEPSKKSQHKASSLTKNTITSGKNSSGKRYTILHRQKTVNSGFRKNSSAPRVNEYNGDKHKSNIHMN